MNDSARITSFDQLSSLKIDVMPNPAQDTTAQVSAERPTKKQNFQPRTQQQQQPKQSSFSPKPVANAEEEADDLPF